MNETYLAAGAFAIGLILYWLVARRLKSGQVEDDVAMEMQRILNDSQYKTKGRFEE